jgi:hypothetical protein
MVDLAYTSSSIGTSATTQQPAPHTATVPVKDVAAASSGGDDVYRLSAAFTAFATAWPFFSNLEDIFMLLCRLLSDSHHSLHIDRVVSLTPLLPQLLAKSHSAVECGEVLLAVLSRTDTAAPQQERERTAQVRKWMEEELQQWKEKQTGEAAAVSTGGAAIAPSSSPPWWKDDPCWMLSALLAVAAKRAPVQTNVTTMPLPVPIASAVIMQHTAAAATTAPAQNDHTPNSCSSATHKLEAAAIQDDTDAAMDEAPEETKEHAAADALLPLLQPAASSRRGQAPQEREVIEID